MSPKNGRGVRIGRVKRAPAGTRPGKPTPAARFYTSPDPGVPFRAVRRPIVFGEDLPKAKRTKLRVSLSEHFLATLGRDSPVAALEAVPEMRFHPTRMWRFDLAWPSVRVAVECDGGIYSGGAHVRGGHVESDAEKVSEAACLGWRVLRVTRKMIDDGRAVRLVERALAYREREGDA